MITNYLFDWGDTLMIDFPNAKGKMCDWENVAAVKQAKATLAALSQQAKIYIATGAADSSERDIKRAFERVELAPYISGYFCQANVGAAKGEPDFLKKILSTLNVNTNTVAMVGDNFDKDIKPALAANIQAFWFTKKHVTSVPENVQVIHCLSALLSEL